MGNTGYAVAGYAIVGGNALGGSAVASNTSGAAVCFDTACVVSNRVMLVGFHIYLKLRV